MGLEELDAIRKKITSHRVFVQLPAGLMPLAAQVQEHLKGLEVFFSSHPCFGACDLDDLGAERVGAGAIINVGHSAIRVKTRIPSYFVEWRQEQQLDFDPRGLPKRLGLVTTVQHSHLLEFLKEKLEAKGFEVFLGEPGAVSTYLGQVTGCDVNAAVSISAKVDGFLFLGSSRFHGMKVAVETGKPVWFLDEGKLSKLDDIEVSKEIRLRQMRKALAWNHKIYGILVSTKLGQFHLEEAQKLKKLLEEKGKKVLMLVGDVFRPEELGNFEVDVFVTSACPRMVEDYEVFGKPVYSVEDLSTQNPL